jgi:putative tryptophan/tyrosine transport system substrate-binding protein
LQDYNAALWSVGADMRRREFIGLIGAAALSSPRRGYAQTRTGLPVVGFLLPLKSDTTFARDRIAAVRKGLREAGFIEGTNYSLAVRFAEGDLGRYPEILKELGALNARVIVIVGALYGIGEFLSRWASSKAIRIRAG